MSIASRVSGYWGEKLYPEGFILIEPKVAEKAIALIIDDEFEAAEELARLLLVLERGIEAEIPEEGPGRCPATRETIALMIELAYLESKNYHGSLKEWREALERLNAGTSADSGKNKADGGGRSTASGGDAKRSAKRRQAATSKRRPASG
jgi:hypothetical protein